LFVQAEGRERFSTEFLRDVVLSFIIAGRDTTGCTLSWLFYVLSTHPEIQARLCAEIDKCLPQEEAITLKSMEHSNMPYLNGVLYETLRLYPPVPFDIKEAQADDVLPDGTPVPKNTKMIFLPYAMGRDPQRYPDPEAVMPERWIPFKMPSPYEFPVFQGGPRICLGMDMAIFEAKLVACTLLQAYSFELAPGEADKITYGRKLTMAVANDRGQATESGSLLLIPRRRESY